MADKYQPVIFENSRGDIISNDPVYLAQQTIDAYTGGNSSNGDDEAIDTSPYADMNGRDLKAAAKERGVDISGMKTVGEVRRALEEDDAAKAEAPAEQSTDDKA
jgi:pyruvate/2-oxoglutarate dehydrogenase complex dihydrolipoamide acyltransferase (E2) component